MSDPNSRTIPTVNEINGVELASDTKPDVSARLGSQIGVEVDQYPPKTKPRGVMYG